MGKFKRGKKIIDKRFQFKTTFTITGIIVISFIAVIAATGILTITNTVRINNSIGELNDSITKEDNMIKAFIKFSEESVYSSFFPNISKVKKDHAKSMKVIHNHINFLKEIIEHNRLLIIIMIAVGLILAIGLSIYLIIFTHRIAGPTYVLSKHINDILEGKKPEMRKLRKNDEMQELYDKFVEMVNKMKLE